MKKYQKIMKEIEKYEEEMNKIDDGPIRDHELEEEVLNNLKNIVETAQFYKNSLIKKYKKIK